jgi:hypothetical protein
VSLLEDLELERDNLTNPEKKCLVCRWLKTQDLETCSQIESWILDGLPIKRLHRICRKNNFPASSWTFYKHACVCVRKEEDGIAVWERRCLTSSPG